MAATISTADKILKFLYSPRAIQNAVYDKNPLFALMPKQGGFNGRSMIHALTYGNSLARSAAFATAQGRAGILVPSENAAEAAVVLHRTVDVERRVHVVGDVEELAHRQVEARVLPRLPAVVRHVEAAVAADQQAIGVLRVPVDDAEVAEGLGEHADGRPRRALPRLPAVPCLVEDPRHVAGPDGQDVRRPLAERESVH